MSDNESIRLPVSPAAAAVKELDESIWRTWTAKNALRDRQGAAARLVAVKCASLGILLIATIPWGYVAPYQVAIRFALSLGALAVAAQALRSRRYGFAAVFAAIVLIYNPFVATFSMTGGWPFPLVFLTGLAFAASLIWLRDRPAGDPQGPSALKEPAFVKADLSAWENEGGAPEPPHLDLAAEQLKGVRK